MADKVLSFEEFKNLPELIRQRLSGQQPAADGQPARAVLNVQKTPVGKTLPVTERAQTKAAADAAPASVGNPTPNQNLEALSMAARAEQKKAANDDLRGLEEKINEYLNRPQQVDLSALVGLADSWSGSKLSQSYKRPETKEERATKAIELQDALSKRRGAIAKDEMDFLGDLIKSRDAKLNAKSSEDLAIARMAATQGRSDRAYNENSLKEFTKAIDKNGLAELGAVAKNITSLINLDSDNEIEGFGKNALQPSATLSEKGQKTRQAVTQLQNIILKARSGGAVTPQEADRLLSELGVGATRTDKELRIGIKNTLSALAAKQNNLVALASPGTLEEYESRTKKPLYRFQIDQKGGVNDASTGGFDPSAAAAELARRKKK